MARERELLDHISKEKIEYATSAEATRNIKEEYELDDHSTNSISIRSKPEFQSSNHESKIHTDTTINNLPIEPKPIDEDIQNLLFSQKIDPSLQKNTENKESPEKWMASLPKEEGYYLLPGNITTRRPKAVAFQFNTGKTIWIPLSIMKDPLAESKIWVKSWFLEKNLNQIFSPS